MGYLHNWPNVLLWSQCDAFVETGTQMGRGVECALNMSCFDEIHSIEINPGFYSFCVDRFRERDEVKLHLGNSIDTLPGILKLLEGKKSCLFWLDAHIPEDVADSGYEFSFEDVETGLPLERELEIITSHRDISNDYFLIDDLRIYATPQGTDSISSPAIKSAAPDLHLEQHQLDDLKSRYPGYFPHESGSAVLTKFFKSHWHAAAWTDQGYLLVGPKSDMEFPRRVQRWTNAWVNSDQDALNGIVGEQIRMHREILTKRA